MGALARVQADRGKQAERGQSTPGRLRQAIGEGEWLSVRLHTTGTMTGSLMLSDGTLLPATGQPIDQDWSALVRFESDRIAQFDEYYDQLTLMLQLGLLAP